MRTTVALDGDVERLLRETARRTHRPFKKGLNDTLRAGHDPAGFKQLADDLEAEAFLETMLPEVVATAPLPLET